MVWTNEAEADNNTRSLKSRLCTISQSMLNACYTRPYSSYFNFKYLLDVAFHPTSLFFLRHKSAQQAHIDGNHSFDDHVDDKHGYDEVLLEAQVSVMHVDDYHVDEFR